MSDQFPTTQTPDARATAFATEWYGEPCPTQPDRGQCLCPNCHNWYGMHNEVLATINAALEQDRNALADIIETDYELGDLQVRQKIAALVRRGP